MYNLSLTDKCMQRQNNTDHWMASTLCEPQAHTICLQQQSELFKILLVSELSSPHAEPFLKGHGLPHPLRTQVITPQPAAWV